MLFPSFAAKKWTVLKLISWKHSFKRLNEEYEMVKKKKQALDNLLNSERISQSTHELISKEIDEALAGIVKQQEALLEKMSSKMMELEGQIKTLEMLLANSEIRHVTGEVNEEVYQREISLLSMGLETTRQELDSIKEAVNQLSTSMKIPATDIVAQQEVESTQNVEVSKAEAKTKEEPAVETSEMNSSQTPQEQPQETLQSPEESQSTETIAESKEKQEA